MKKNKLKRTVGLVSATTIGLGVMLGAGIFVFPGLAGGYTGFSATISFMIGGIVAMLVAACTAELATAMPQSGGGYFFVSRTFGQFWGTIVGISQWIGLIFACSFYLVCFGEYTISLLKELNIVWDLKTKLFSFSFTLLLLVINIIGTKKVGQFQNIMVISLTIILVLIFTYGLIDFVGIEDKKAAFSEIAPKGVISIFPVTALIFTSYLGFSQIANIGSEIKKPSKNLPRSLIGSVLIAMVLYIFIVFVCTYTFPIEELKRYGENATVEVARSMLGKFGATLVLFAAILAALSSANASLLSASRGVFALSNDGVITKKASQINKHFGTPHVALILVAVPIFIILIKNELEIFAEVASCLHLVIYAGICLAVLKLRAKAPLWYIPTFRIPFHKIIAGTGTIACLLLICFMQKISIIISLGILSIAVGYYYLFVKNKGAQIHQPTPPHISANLLQPKILIPVDIDQETKSLPHPILKALPISKLLLLGYKETPEQTKSEQAEDSLGEEGEKKMNNIKNELKDTKIDFNSKLIVGNKVTSQIEEFIEEKDLQYILTLKPLSQLKQLLVPIYESSQINNKLGTTIHNLCSKKPIEIKVLIFTENKEGETNEFELKKGMSQLLSRLNIKINRFGIFEKNSTSPKKAIEESAKKTDLVLWSEGNESKRETFLNIIFEKEPISILSPIIMILNRDNKK